MPQTPLGITYPDDQGHTRLWEHLQTLADNLQTLLAIGRPDDGDDTIMWHWHTMPDWSFTNGSLNVNYAGTTPAGWEWAEPPAAVCQFRSNSLPSKMFTFAIGNQSTTGCTVHARRGDTSAPANTSLPVTFTLIGRIRPIT